MNGIFPDYVGPTIEYRFASLYPDWVGDGLFEVIIEEDSAEGGSGASRSSLDKLRSTAHGRRLLQEDEELMAILMVAVRVLQ